MAQRIRQNDTVKVIAGGLKGRTGKVVKVDPKNNRVFIEGVNLRERHVAPNRLNPRGGKKEVHVGLDISNVALVFGEKNEVTKVAYKTIDGKKVRIARKTGKEIK
jgi:large subunit ribosomal protein L24